MALLTRTSLRINRYCSMADFPFFKMAAVRHLRFLKVKNFNFRSPSGRRHLGFSKFQIFNGWDAQEGRTASACQILSKSLKPRLRYGDFSIFQRGGRPPSWILKSWKFQLRVPFGGPMCVIVPNFVEIARNAAEICKF